MYPRLLPLPRRGPGSVPLSALDAEETAAQNRFDALFAAYYPAILRLALRVVGQRADAEDVAQEAFLRLSNTPTLLERPDAEAGAWLRRVTLNLAFNRLRDRSRAQIREERAARLAPTVVDAASVTAEAEQAEAHHAVQRALAALPERQRDCLLLRHAGYSYAEIAQTLGVASGSVGVLLARGERAFRAAYLAENPDALDHQATAANASTLLEPPRKARS